MVVYKSATHSVFSIILSCYKIIVYMYVYTVCIKYIVAVTLGNVCFSDTAHSLFQICHLPCLLLPGYMHVYN